MRRELLRTLLLIAIVFSTVSKCQAFSGGSGTELDPYQISTRDDLVGVSLSSSSHFIMTNDIDLSGEIFDTRVISGTFSGVFNGQGYRVIGCEITNAISGLFLRISGTVKNLSVIGIEVSGSNSVAAFTSFVDASGVVEDCYVEGTLTVEATHLAGFVRVNNGTVRRCGADAAIFENDSSVFSNAGVFVSHNYGTISDSYAVGEITGETLVGGFAAYNTATGLIERCYSSVVLNAAAGNTHGFVGYTQQGSLSACFWDTDAASNFSTGANPESGVVGLSSAEMQNQVNFTDAGWDFVGESVNGTSDVWSMPASGMPIFAWQANGRYCITPPFFDHNGDCLVNMIDLAAMAAQWLECGYANQSLCPN